MNKLTIVILGTMFATAITPMLASAESWPQIDQSFYCAIDPLKIGADTWEQARMKVISNFDCLSAQTNALKNWVDAILKQLPLPTKTLPGLPPLEEVHQEGIPTVPIVPCYKTGEFMTQACDEKGYPVTQEGWEGGEVTVIQDFLKAEGSFTFPRTTGYFGPITEQAVRTFQIKYSLPSTGVVDKPTLEKMQSASQQVAPALKSRINDLKPTSKP